MVLSVARFSEATHSLPSTFQSQTHIVTCKKTGLGFSQMKVQACKKYRLISEHLSRNSLSILIFPIGSKLNPQIIKM